MTAQTLLSPYSRKDRRSHLTDMATDNTPYGDRDALGVPNQLVSIPIRQQAETEVGLSSFSTRSISLVAIFFFLPISHQLMDIVISSLFLR